MQAHLQALLHTLLPAGQGDGVGSSQRHMLGHAVAVAAGRNAVLGPPRQLRKLCKEQAAGQLLCCRAVYDSGSQGLCGVRPTTSGSQVSGVCLV